MLPSLARQVVEVDPRSVRLDPENPRIPSEHRVDDQDELLGFVAKKFKVDDLARSIASRGFLNVDPIICFEEGGRFVVREGNRRIAALQLLLEPDRAPDGHVARWRELAKDAEAVQHTLSPIAIWIVDDKDDADLLAYIGFRHVSGILAWESHEKAAYIAYLIKKGLNYYETGREIGSRSDAVERHYVAQKVVEQAVQTELPGARVMQRHFGVLLRALNSPGVRDYLGLQYSGSPSDADEPVPGERVDALANFVRWTFGDDEGAGAVVTDSRQLTEWGRILKSAAAVRYLSENAKPSFKKAQARATGDLQATRYLLEEIQERIDGVVDQVRTHRADDAVQRLVRECVAGTEHLASALAE